MFTANTMSSAVEALGMALPSTCSAPAVTQDNVVTEKKKAQCVQLVEAAFQLLQSKITSRQIMTKKVSHVIM